MREVQILGTGHYAPDNVVTNEDLSKIVDTSDEWIVSRTGIKERRISSGENTSDISLKAAINALENSGVKAEDLDLIIVATITADMYTPSVACMIQGRLGACNASAFDINAACTGFIYALNIGTQFIKTGQCNKVLIVGAEVLSKIVSWKDRNTCVLFGDGAGAAVIGESPTPSIISINVGADGKKGYTLEADGRDLKTPFIKLQDTNINDEYVEKFIVMEGREVFKFATSVIVKSIEKILLENNVNKEDLKYIVPHQANLRILDYASKKLNISIDKFYTNLESYGNTSAASIPIALDEMNRSGMLQKGDLIILVGFGGGLTYGAALIKW